jgi:DNA-binding CsgD family transcriptional regulator
MKAFSGLLLDLYRLGQTTRPAEFQKQALDAVREVLAFDSALWGTGVMGPQGAIVHSACVYRQPPEMMENWERIKQHDTVSFEAFGRIGQTVNAALTTDPAWQSRFHSDAMAHVKRFGMEHVLATIMADPVLGLFAAVSFYRADSAQPFSEAERLFKQNLVPHLAEVWNTNRFNFMHVAHNDSALPDHALAICDRKGVLYNASQNFARLMFIEWRDWQGPQLPGVLLGILNDTRKRRYTGLAIVATIKPLNDMLLLGLRKKSVVDQLSPRELEVARRFARGMEYRKIAVELNIAPATVRNHLQAIYSTLEVSNKVEMARIMVEADD